MLEPRRCFSNVSSGMFLCASRGEFQKMFFQISFWNIQKMFFQCFFWNVFGWLAGIFRRCFLQCFFWNVSGWLPGCLLSGCRPAKVQTLDSQVVVFSDHGAILGWSWGILGSSWGGIGGSWGHLGVVLGHLGATGGPCYRPPNRPKIDTKLSGIKKTQILSGVSSIS